MRDPRLHIAIDFDGVLYSFASGWQGARCINDPPTAEAIAWLRKLLEMENVFTIGIFSARVYRWGGRKAMKRWLFKHGLPWSDVQRITFWKKKPICHLLIDDRVICFDGRFPSPAVLTQFKPWHKKEVW